MNKIISLNVYKVGNRYFVETEDNGELLAKREFVNFPEVHDLREAAMFDDMYNYVCKKIENTINKEIDIECKTLLDKRINMI